MAFVTITAGQTDANSPIDQLLMDTIRENLDDLDGRVVTNGDSHDHSGGDGAVIPRGGLKTTTGEVSTILGSANLVVTGGEYCFYPQLKHTSPETDMTAFLYASGTSGISTSYLTLIGLGIGSSGQVYAKHRYIQSSPPYKIGNKRWGHFLFLLVDIATGEVKSASEAEDPPWAYNGPSGNPKDSKERIQSVPHPFANYFDKDPSIDGLEIVLVDLREHNTKKWKEDNAKKGKGILEDLQGNINPNGIIIPNTDLLIPDIAGFTDKVKIRKRT